MRHLHRNFFIVAGLALGVTAANAAGIGPGSMAPALDVKKWYKGTPVKGFEKDKTYIVEFWATWCGPCITSIPHVTKLAKENPDVTVIGVSIWEEDEGTKIQDFIDKMGDKMDYNVGYSGNKEGMAQTWMDAAGQNGIPSAFIIKNQQIQWVGHPMSMDKPLAEIKAGTFDVEAFRVDFEKKAEANRQAAAARAELNVAQKLVNAGKYAEAKTKLDEIEAKSPAMKPQTQNMRFALLAKDDPAAWDSQAKELANSKDAAKVQILISYALAQNWKRGDVGKGTRAINLALRTAEDKDLLTFYNAATFYQNLGYYKTARVWAEKAVAAIPISQFKDNDQAKTAITKLRDDIVAMAKKS